MAVTYHERRSELREYFDRTAADAWARLTSTAPVNRIRATVRAGRNAMRATFLEFLPADMGTLRLLDAGCGTGALSLASALRGARVVAIDLSPTLITLARERLPSPLPRGSIDFKVGDMVDDALGSFDHVVAMDSLIHYPVAEVVRVLTGFTAYTRHSIVFTFAPKTPALMLMWTVGRLFPRKNRAPALEPLSERDLRKRLREEPALSEWRVARTRRIVSGFYKSQVMELVRV